MSREWADDIGALLTELSDTQTELLALLAEKRQLLVDRRLEELEALQPRERELAARLQNCQDMRQQLLHEAGEQGLPADTLRDLAASLDDAPAGKLAPQFTECAGQSRLLQHTSLSNWVFVQKSLLHLSQLIEIIATGGREQPTYGNAESYNRGGTMVDQAV